MGTQPRQAFGPRLAAFRRPDAPAGWAGLASHLAGRHTLLVFAVVVAALALRLFGTNWDAGHMFHPDERFIFMTSEGLDWPKPFTLEHFLSADSQLNPKSFAYGSLSFYLLRGSTSLLGWVGDNVGALKSLADFGRFDQTRLVGRALSALFDVGTLLVCYFIGRRLFGRWVGLLAATFIAFSVLNVQLSHFYASDTPMTFFVTAAIYCSIRLAQGGSRRWTVFAGLTVGLAMATKVSAAPVFAAIGVAFLIRAFFVESEGRLHPRGNWPAELSRVVILGTQFLGVALLVFVVCEPYALIDFSTFSRNVAEQNAMVQGVADLPYTRQYENRPAYLYFLQNLTIFGFGLPLGLAAIAGWLYVIVRAVRRPRIGDLILLALAVPYFAITGDFHTKFMRYLLPIAPLLCLFAAEGLSRLLVWASQRGPVLFSTAVEFAKTTSAAGQPLSNAAQVDTSGGQAVELDASAPAVVLASGTPPAKTVTPEEAAEVRREYEEARRLAELKGLSFFDDLLPDEPTDAAPYLAGQLATVASDPAPDYLDAEARRWAVLKGFSFDVFEPDESAELHATGSAQPLPTMVTPPVANPTGSTTAIAGGIPTAAPESPARLSFSWLGAGVATLIGLVILATGLYALAYDRIYLQPHTAVAASTWLYQNAPRGSVIATEHWEEGMPVTVNLAGREYSSGTQNYRTIPLNLYEDDNEGKLSHVVQQLTTADYVVFFSNRLYGTIPRLPVRYPMTSEYYRLLFGEQLGYQLVGAFSSYPNVLGVAFSDDTLNDPGLPAPPLLAEQEANRRQLSLGHADESFSVYDHPKVLIFKKTTKLTPDQLRALLRPALQNRPNAVAQRASQAPLKSLLLTPAQVAADEAGGTFIDLFNRSGFANQAPILVWILMLEVLGLAAAPIAFAVCRGLADRGYLIAKTLGVLILSWLAWMLVNLGLPNGLLPAYLALGILVTIGGIVGHLQREEIFEFLRERRWTVLLAEGIFWAAFVAFLGIRLANPDLWHPARGGEKPMDIAYLMAAIKSTTFPPYDPWFAGGYLNYYYYGQILVATLIKLAGVVPTMAYNLVVPTLFALTFGGAFSVASSLIGRASDNLAAGLRANRRAVVGGLAGAFFVCVLGNIAGGEQFTQQVAKTGSLAFDSAVPLLGPIVRFLFGLLAVVAGRPMPIPTDWYWASTRVIPGTINEFPFFTFLYADLHAHMIALPLTLLALGLAVNIVKTKLEDWDLPVWPRPWRSAGFAATGEVGLREMVPGRTTRELAGDIARPVASVLVVSLSVGALMPTNSWDYPTYLGITILALLIPWYVARDRSLERLRALVLRAVLIGALSYLLYLPFHQAFQSFYFGLKPIPDKSEVNAYLAIHGFFLAVLVTFVAIDLFRRFGRIGALRSVWQTARWWDRLPRLLGLRDALVRRRPEGAEGADVLLLTVSGFVLVVAAGLALAGMALVGLLFALIVPVGVLALRRDRRAEETFIFVLIGSGLFLGIVTELVAIDGDVGRMNTVFKFYLQVWVMWGLASAVALAWIWDWLTGGRHFSPRWVVAAVIAVVFALSAVYPFVATWARTHDRYDVTVPPTLDGTAYMTNSVWQENNRPIRLVSDAEAIRWIQDNIPGSPVILEATAPLYHWGARISIYTGLPTVIGWDWHQKQQRAAYQDDVDARILDVRTMYNDPSVAKTVGLLAKYHVSFIYLGEEERIFYPSAPAKLDQLVGKQLEVVYDNDGVRIYRVISYEW